MPNYAGRWGRRDEPVGDLSNRAPSVNETNQDQVTADIIQWLESHR